MRKDKNYKAWRELEEEVMSDEYRDWYEDNVEHLSYSEDEIEQFEDLLEEQANFLLDFEIEEQKRKRKRREEADRAYLL